MQGWRGGRALWVGGAATLGLFLAIQLVPDGRGHPNPPVTAEAPWPSDEAAAIARRSCYACHSNETVWPAYAQVAPVSWLVRADVHQGREALNFSTWDRDRGEADDAADEVRDGDMPPGRYTLLHRDARLTAEEARTLIAALEEMEG